MFSLIRCPSVYCNWYNVLLLVMQVPERNAQQNKEKRTRTCQECKKPLKGHKNVLDCLRNKKWQYWMIRGKVPNGLLLHWNFCPFLYVSKFEKEKLTTFFQSTKLWGQGRKKNIEIQFSSGPVHFSFQFPPLKCYFIFSFFGSLSLLAQ